MFSQHPEVGTKQLWKTVYAYDKYNREEEPTRAMTLDRLKIVLHYLYSDIATDYGWPTVTKAVKEFAGGKYFGLIQSYLASFDATKIQRMINRSDLTKAGAKPEKIFIHSSCRSRSKPRPSMIARKID